MASRPPSKTLYIKSNGVVFYVRFPLAESETPSLTQFTIDMESNDPNQKLGQHEGGPFPDVVRSWLNLNELNDGDIHLEELIPISLCGR